MKVLLRSLLLAVLATGMLASFTYAGIQLSSFTLNQFTFRYPSSTLDDHNRLILLEAQFLFPDDETSPGLSVNGSGKATLIGKLLMYPNPFSQKSGADIGYYLSNDANVEFRIYDMQANLVLKKSFIAGANGGFGNTTGYNRVHLNASDFGNPDLSSGVYVYLLICDGKLIGKGKVVIKPSL